MNRATFLWLLDHSIPFNRYMITQLNERLGQFIGMMENERMLGIDTRIARVLAALFNPVLYPGTQRLLQSRRKNLVISPGSPSSGQSRDQGIGKAGLVRCEYGGIRVIDLDGLQHFGKMCNRPVQAAAPATPEWRTNWPSPNSGISAP